MMYFFNKPLKNSLVFDSFSKKMICDVFGVGRVPLRGVASGYY